MQIRPLALSRRSTAVDIEATVSGGTSGVPYAAFAVVRFAKLAGGNQSSTNLRGGQLVPSHFSSAIRGTLQTLPIANTTEPFSRADRKDYAYVPALAA